MPSDVKGRTPSSAPPIDPAAGEPLDPPGVTLVVRLFVIPAVIVAVAVGVMFVIGLLAGQAPSVEESIAGLRHQGGGRTMDVLLGPGSKQRYLYAKAIIDQMKQGMPVEARVKLADELIDVLDNFTNVAEGDIRNLLLMALGRVWQKPLSDEPADPAADASRDKVANALLRYADDPNVQARKAALLAMAFLKGRPETAQFIPKLVAVVGDARADLDVRLAAATALGPLADPTDARVVEALNAVVRQTSDPREAELIWSAALTLAQLGQEDAADTVVRLLDRAELDALKVYDREADPRNPSMRPLTDQEKQRFIINAMEGAKHLDAPVVWEKIARLSTNDPSDRVRYAAREVLQRRYSGTTRTEDGR